MSQAWLIMSGKGGVGKSTFAASLGVNLAKNEKTCCCVDTDMGLRCLDMLFNLENEVIFDIVDVAEKNSKLKYSVIPHHAYGQLALLPASQLRKSSALDTETLSHIIRKLKKRYAYVIIDAPAGIGKSMDPLLEVADKIILVTTPDDVSIRDAENVIELVRKKKSTRPMLVVNRVNSALLYEGYQYSPEVVAQTLDIPLLGYIPEDITAAQALHEHKTIAECRGEAHDALERISTRFLGEYVEMPPIRKKRRFFSRLRSRR